MIYQEINKLLKEENNIENNNKKNKHKKRVKEVQTFAEAYKQMRLKRTEQKHKQQRVDTLDHI